jgi:hypothetical protein
MKLNTNLVTRVSTKDNCSYNNKRETELIWKMQINYKSYIF